MTATIGHNGAPPDNAMRDLQAILGTMRSARIKRGLTQQNLASGIGLTRQAVSAVENGVCWPTLNNACFLARALGYRLALVKVED